MARVAAATSAGSSARAGSRQSELTTIVTEPACASRYFSRYTFAAAACANSMLCPATSGAVADVMPGACAPEP